MSVIKISNVPLNPNPHGVEARKIFESQNLAFVHIELKPGDTIGRHSGMGDVFFFFYDGEGTLLYGNEEIKVTAGTFIKSPAGNLHGWKNNSERNMKILAIKTS